MMECRGFFFIFHHDISTFSDDLSSSWNDYQQMKFYNKQAFLIKWLNFMDSPKKICLILENFRLRTMFY